MHQGDVISMRITRKSRASGHLGIQVEFSAPIMDHLVPSWEYQLLLHATASPEAVEGSAWNFYG